jgi:WD repeat-containing protein 61
MPQADDAAPGGPRRERFVLAVAYSPDFKLLAASAMDGTVAVYDAASGQLLHSLKGHHRPVRALAFTPGTRGARRRSRGAALL